MRQAEKRRGKVELTSVGILALPVRDHVSLEVTEAGASSPAQWR